MEAAGIEPACPKPQTFTNKELANDHAESAAVWQRNQVPPCQSLTLPDSEGSLFADPALEYLWRAWRHLPPHVKDAVVTLIDAALLQQGEPQ